MLSPTLSTGRKGSASGGGVKSPIPSLRRCSLLRRFAGESLGGPKRFYWALGPKRFISRPVVISKEVLLAGRALFRGSASVRRRVKPKRFAASSPTGEISIRRPGGALHLQKMLRLESFRLGGRSASIGLLVQSASFPGPLSFLTKCFGLGPKGEALRLGSSASGRGYC